MQHPDPVGSLHDRPLITLKSMKRIERQSIALVPDTSASLTVLGIGAYLNVRS